MSIKRREFTSESQKPAQDRAAVLTLNTILNFLHYKYLHFNKLINCRFNLSRLQEANTKHHVSHHPEFMQSSVDI